MIIRVKKKYSTQCTRLQGMCGSIFSSMRRLGQEIQPFKLIGSIFASFTLYFSFISKLLLSFQNKTIRWMSLTIWHSQHINNSIFSTRRQFDILDTLTIQHSQHVDNTTFSTQQQFNILDTSLIRHFCHVHNSTFLIRQFDILDTFDNLIFSTCRQLDFLNS